MGFGASSAEKPASVGPHHRSYSQLNQVRTCGYAFQLARIEKKPERPNIPAVMGRVFHAVSEEIDRLLHDQTHRGRDAVQGTNQLVSAVESLTSKTLVNETESTIAVSGPVDSWLFYGKQTYEVWVETILPRTIRNYIDWRLASGYTLMELPGFGPAIEIPFLIDLGGVVVKGYIDRVFQMNDTPLILDLKSGRKPETIEQLAIYRVALETLYGRDFRWGAYLYDIKGGNGGPTLTSPFDLRVLTADMLVTQFGKVNQIIDLGLFVAKPSDFCFHCSVSPHCQFSLARA
jgi:putative RecB family exonuclease